jgi:hypothetical protein
MGPPGHPKVTSGQKKKPDRHSLGKTQKPKERPAGPPAGSKLPDKICYKIAERLPQLPYTYITPLTGFLFQKIAFFCGEIG